MKIMLALKRHTKRTVIDSEEFDKCVWRPCGPMDKAPDYGSGDSRFESWQGRFSFPFFSFLFPLFFLNTHLYLFIGYEYLIFR